MIITENTKISQLIRENPAAIEAIASINSHFQKLRNPFLRKILASRVTIKEAAKIGGSSISEFFQKLSPLGFEVDDRSYSQEAFNLGSFKKPKVRRLHKILDVQEDLNVGNDPFKKIMDAVKELSQGETLLLINSFEPVPLIKILKTKGYEIDASQEENGLAYTYISKKKEESEIEARNEYLADSSIFNSKMNQLQGRIELVDVRNMEMPLPMVTVLERLEGLKDEHALFVHHFKIPYFLLEELQLRGYSYVINQEEESVFLLIAKKGKL